MPLSDKIATIFKPGASQHKPDLTCPSVFKRMDGYLPEKWKWYHDRAWIVAACFVK